MSDLDDLMNRIPVDSIAARLGADPEAVRAAVGASVPTLLAGLQAQTGDEQQAQRLAGALADHNDSLAAGDIAIDDVDTEDGSKIVTKMFGDQSPEVASALSEAVPAAGVDQGLVKKLLPMLAPIVMSFVAGKMMGGRSGQAQSADNASGGLGDILGGLLGGGGGGGGGMGDILGGLLGGGKENSALGGILGGLLGGGR